MVKPTLRFPGLVNLICESRKLKQTHNFLPRPTVSVQLLKAYERDGHGSPTRWRSRPLKSKNRANRTKIRAYLVGLTISKQESLA
jgi:hypothetical protein